MTKLYIIRHGKTDWNGESRTQGQSDIPLNEEGRSQANLLGHYLKTNHISNIYTSDLLRAKETAEIISSIINAEIHTFKEIREMAFGKWEGLTKTEIQQKYSNEMDVWNKSPHKCTISEGENLIEVQQRALTVIDKIVASHPGENIALVSHGVTIKAIILGILGIELTHFNKFAYSNTGVSIIDYRESGPVLLQHNSIHHLVK